MERVVVRYGYSLRTFSPCDINLIPEFLAPMNQVIYIPFNVFGALATSDRIHFDSYFLHAESTNDRAYAGFQESFAVPCHAKLHHFGKRCISSEQSLVGCADFLAASLGWS